MGRFDYFATKMDWGSAPPEPTVVPVETKPKGTYDRGDPSKDAGRRIKKGKKRKK